MGLGYWLGFHPMLGAGVFGVLSACAIGVAHRRLGSGMDTLISMVWAVGMALGIVFVSLQPGYAPDLMTYLFGSLLYAPWGYVAAVGALDLLIVAVVVIAFRPLQAIAFDEEFAEVAGLPVQALSLVLLGLVAVAVVTLIRVVGVVLAIALMTIPAATARQWVATLPRMMVLATALAMASVLGGLMGSAALSEYGGVSVPPGPLIILVAVAGYLGSWLARAGRGNDGPGLEVQPTP